MKIFINNLNMEKSITFTRDNKNYHLYISNIADKNLLNFIVEKQEFRILFLSKNFSIYPSHKAQKNIEQIIALKWLNEIWFFWLAARQMEDIADNAIVNFWMNQVDETVLSILTTSEDDILSEWFLHAFINDWFSKFDGNKYVKDNYIISDDETLIESFFVLS